MRPPYDGTGPVYPAGLVPKKAKLKPKVETAPEEPEIVTISDDLVSEDLEFDPAENSVEDVLSYLDDNPDQTEFVLERERAGKARATLLSKKEI